MFCVKRIVDFRDLNCEQVVETSHHFLFGLLLNRNCKRIYSPDIPLGLNLRNTTFANVAKVSYSHCNIVEYAIFIVVGREDGEQPGTNECRQSFMQSSQHCVEYAIFNVGREDGEQPGTNDIVLARSTHVCTAELMEGE
jgi:hypothetical protein